MFEVGPSGYYGWKNNKISARDRRDAYLSFMIKEIHRNSRGIYGCPRIYAELKANGEQISYKRTYRLMKENNIQGKHRHKFKVTTNSKHNNPIFPNLLEQNFKVTAPNQVWVSDISYFWTQEGWMYLAIVLDLYSRKVVGWEMKDRMTQTLVTTAFLKAYWARKPKTGLIHHSDRGSQYTALNFQKILTQLGVKSSMSGKGNCFDNAVAESFFHTIKNELTFNQSFKTKQQVKSAVFEYIEAFYNTKRRHSNLFYCSPTNFEQYYYNKVS